MMPRRVSRTISSASVIVAPAGSPPDRRMQPVLRNWSRVFGVTAVPDGMGGFVHNAAIAVIDPGGHLVAILDWDDPGAAAAYVEARLVS